MSTSLLDELEKLLSETNHEKQRLNFICETVWNLLNPPGTEKNGLFKIEKKDKTEQTLQVSEETTNMSSSLGESLESVTKLIALGKLVRDSTRFEKKKNCRPNSISDVCHTSLPWKEKLETVTQVAHNKRVSSCKGFIKEVKSDNCVKQNDKKPDFLPDKTSSSLKNNLSSRPGKVKQEVSSDFTNHNKNLPEMSLNTDCSTTLSKGYTHLCSNSLSNLVKSLKMPEDLRCILKHHHYFEKHKENISSLENSPKPSLQTFCRRFQNVIKLKLNNDLKTNFKHTERYLKYLDIAEEITKTKSKPGENYCSVEYSSINDLELQEAKMQHLMELKLKIRLLDVVSNKLSN